MALQGKSQEAECIDISMQSSMLVSLHVLWFICLSFCFLTILRIATSILQGELSRCLSLKWDFYFLPSFVSKSWLVRKPHYTKNSEYETGFEEISIPFNGKNIQDTKAKIKSAQLAR